MDRKHYILAISLFLIVFLCSSVSFAQGNTTDMPTVPENNDMTILNEGDSNVNQTHSQHTITVGSDSATIQNEINSMNDGDILNF